MFDYANDKKKATGRAIGIFIEIITNLRILAMPIFSRMKLSKTCFNLLT